MAKDLYIGNTDHDWFDFCKARPSLEEVNFWRPSKSPFKALNEGGIFFFRRKAPINKIGGFGVFASTGQITIGQAWDDLGFSNGLESLEEFISRVRKYRDSKIVDRQTLITFNIIATPVFLAEQDWIDVPSDWSPNIVTGKSYSSDSEAGANLLKLFRQNMKAKSFLQDDARTFGFFNDTPQAGYSFTKNQKIRLGQGAFRVAVFSAYQGRCAVTGTTVPAALQAAHIRKYSDHPDNRVTNGILLRSDIHSLYDNGLLEITPEYRVRLTERFRELFPESSEYLCLDGKHIALPDNPNHLPEINPSQPA